jgi:hypothetical protein
MYDFIVHLVDIETTITARKPEFLAPFETGAKTFLQPIPIASRLPWPAMQRRQTV